jgi:hypothetical protein
MFCETTIWSEWPRPRWSPFGLIISWLLSCNCHCNYGIQLILLWSVRHEATKLLEGSRVFQKAKSEPAGKTNKPTVWLLMPHELTHRQNRVAIVNSVMAKIFNPCKYWIVTIQPFVKTLNYSVPVLFIAIFYCLTLVRSFYIVRFSTLFDSVFNYAVYFSVLILELYSRYLNPYLIYNNHPAVNKHHTVDSTIFVSV